MGRTLPLADGSYDFAFQSAESEIDEATDEGRKLGVRGRTRIGVTPAAANAIAWLGTLTQHSFFDMESRPPILCALLRQISSGGGIRSGEAPRRIETAVVRKYWIRAELT